MNGNGLKVAVALHVYGDVTAETCLAMLAEQAKPMPREIARLDVIPPGSDALLSRLRSYLVSLAIDGGYDVLVWVDHDLVWAPGDVADLAVRCAQVEATVGGLFPFRSETMRGRGFPWRANPGMLPSDLHLTADELVECECVSGGFVAFWVPALRRMIEILKDSPNPSLKVTKCRANPSGYFWDVCRPVSIPYGDGSTGRDGLSNYLSDDWGLIRRLAAVDVQCFAWTRPWLGHVGRKVFWPSDALGLAGDPEEIRQRFVKLAQAAAEVEAEEAARKVETDP
jgi:hypothetical protein